MRPVFALTYLVILAVNLALAVPAQNGPPNVDTRSVSITQHHVEFCTQLTNKPFYLLLLSSFF